MFKNLFNKILSRQLAQHGSFLAMAIGAVASVLGIPLAPTQISAIISAISVLTYVWSQIKADKPKAE
jgi:hypothetical protein